MTSGCAMGLAFGLLGPLEICRDGTPVTGPVGRQRMVLAMLLLDHARTVSRARLMAELWSDSPPPSAAANLRTYVSGLRAWLARDAGALVRHGDGWLLDLTEGTDVSRFEADLTAGRRAMRIGDWRHAARCLGRAVAAYRGTPFQDVPQGAALSARAAVLTSQWLAAMESYADILLRLGAYEQAHALLREFLGGYPGRERAWALLMLACHRAGDTAGALDVYRSARTALVEGYGIEPGPVLVGVQRAILRREPRSGWRSGARATLARRRQQARRALPA